MRFSAFSRTARCLLPLYGSGALVLVLILVAFVPRSSDAQSSSLSPIREQYQQGNYEAVVDRCTAVAQDETEPEEARRAALRHLARAHLALGEEDEANQAVATLLSREPPAVQFNPDEEPPPLLDIYYQKRREQNGGYVVERETPDAQKVAMVLFTNGSMRNPERWEGLRWGLPSMLTRILGTSPGLQAIHRARVEWLFDAEDELRKINKRSDRSSAMRAGAKLGADAVVTGNFLVHKERMLIQVYVHDVETGEILLEKPASGRPADFASIVQTVSDEIARVLDAEPGTGRTEAVGTTSLDAMRAYADGLMLLADDDYRAARDRFRMAAQQDPAFERATKRAESLTPLLKRVEGGRTPAND